MRGRKEDDGKGGKQIGGVEYDADRCGGGGRDGLHFRKICHGSCTGDIDIAEGGFFECHGSMSGNVTNNAGGYEIHGSFTGEVYGDSDDNEDYYDIDEDI